MHATKLVHKRLLICFKKHKDLKMYIAQPLSMKNVFIPNEKILTSSCGGKRTTTEFGDYNVDLLKHKIKQTVNDYIKCCSH